MVLKLRRKKKMGMNFYAHIRAKYDIAGDYKANEFWDALDDDPKVTELTNGYVWRNTYYKTVEDLNKDYYHVLHIGKSSYGWHFLLCSYPDLGILTLKDWEKEWEKAECEIYTEEDEKITPKEMLSWILDRGIDKRSEEEILKDHNKFCDEHKIGRKYPSYDDYMRDNGAKRGRNGLWAHADCNADTDGTYDITNSVNFW